MSPYSSVGIDVMRELDVTSLRNDGQSIFLRVIDREYFIAGGREALKFTYFTNFLINVSRTDQ